MTKRKLLAADFGASSGRVVLGEWDGSRIQTTELHRFLNEPVGAAGTLYWDVLRLYHELKQGIRKAGYFDSISVDTWGVDFALLDQYSSLLQNPVHYRDSRTAGMMERVFADIPKERLYEITGNQFMEISTLYQLRALQTKQPSLLESAGTMLMMPDFFTYLLCGEQLAECSAASTTQMLDTASRNWSDEIISAAGLPSSLFPAVIPSGAVAGPLLPALREDLGIGPAQVIAGAGHDTQCAMAAVPTDREDFAFISSGTWSLMGTELNSPLTDKTAFLANMNNECGAGGKVAFLKNITGLWLIQECRRQWSREGKMYSYQELEELAKNSSGPLCFIDVDDSLFSPAGDLPGRIREYCRETGQSTPETIGDIVRCVYRSLALKYRKTIRQLQNCTGKKYQLLSIVGGGVKDGYLCQLTADACGIPVQAGPAEATVMGNLGIQLMALGELQSLSELRSMVRISAATREYLPGESFGWDEAFEKYEELQEKTYGTVL